MKTRELSLEATMNLRNDWKSVTLHKHWQQTIKQFEISNDEHTRNTEAPAQDADDWTLIILKMLFLYV